MSSFREIRDFLGEIVVPQLSELKTTLALIDQGVEGVRTNIAIIQAEMKDLRQEQKAMSERHSRLEGNVDGAVERVRLELRNEFLRTQKRRTGQRRPKSLPPET